jgi:hypothetical protein
MRRIYVRAGARDGNRKEKAPRGNEPRLQPARVRARFGVAPPDAPATTLKSDPRQLELDLEPSL